MIIKRIELENYRNYENLELDLSDSVNIFFGDNAQGKTNILESVFVACTTKSHKRSKDNEIIRFGCEDSHIRLIICKNDIDYKIDMHLRRQGRKFVAINSSPIKKASDLLGIANIIFFSPEDLNIIKEGPAERRRFIDMELCQLSRLYLDNIAKYNKCLNQRNKLLKNLEFEHSESVLEAWDEQLVFYGRKVIEERKKFIEDIDEIIRNIHYSLTGNRERLEVKYENNVEEEYYRINLKNSLSKDIRFGSTSVGPHRDDIGFVLDGTDIRKYGSQGQQRTAALSLKLSEIELIRSKTNDSPILLLDDVLSELDEKRQNYLLNSIGNIQTLITCTGIEEFVKSRLNIDKAYSVKEGKVRIYK